PGLRVRAALQFQFAIGKRPFPARRSRRSRRHGLRPPHRADTAGGPATAVENVPAIGLQPADAGAGRHLQAFKYGAAVRVDVAQFALVALPGAVPQFAIDPAYAGDVSIRFDGAQDVTRGRIDLVDPPILVFAYPEAALGPGQARVRALAGSGDRSQHLAGARVDLVDARLGNLVQVPAIEGSARVADAIDRSHLLASPGVEGEQPGPGGRPYVPAVMGDA